MLHPIQSRTPWIHRTEQERKTVILLGKKQAEVALYFSLKNIYICLIRDQIFTKVNV